MASSLVAALPSAASRLSIRRRLRVNARDRKSTRLNSSHTVIYTLSLHDALPIFGGLLIDLLHGLVVGRSLALGGEQAVHQKTAARERQRSEEHTSELQSHSDLHSFPTRRSSDLWRPPHRPSSWPRRWSQPCPRRRAGCPSEDGCA